MKKENSENRITYYESPLLEIARKIVGKGYYLSAMGWRVSNEPEKQVQGILELEKIIKNKFLGITIRKVAVLKHIGNIEVEYDPDVKGDEKTWKDKEEKKWKLQVFDRYKRKKLVELVKEFLEPNNAFLQVEVVSEEPEIIYDYKRNVIEARKFYQRTLLNPEHKKLK